jgi:hypothetical protein
MKRALQAIGVIAFAVWAYWFFIPVDRKSWGVKSEFDHLMEGTWEYALVGSLILLGISASALFASTRAK